jgi:hypothetical protein
MATILQQIGTPLQLVALALLLIAGIARLLVRSGTWKPSPAITRLVMTVSFKLRRNRYRCCRNDGLAGA